MCQGDGYEPLRLISNEGWVKGSSNNHSKDAKSANLYMCNEEGLRVFGAQVRGRWEMRASPILL